MGIEVSFQALNGNRAEHDQKRRMFELAAQRARYEVDRARHQYDAVDPVNRLVAAELEARWNAAMVQATAAETRLHNEAARRSPLMRINANI
jgi:hypothetical protein